MSDVQLQIIITVLTGLFSIIPTIFESNKSSKLKYVTAERSEWRSQMRDITNELSSKKEDKTSIDEILTKYKTRLNPYGDGHDNDYLRDGHIWKVINQIEKDKTNNELIDELIKYISLLLKFDWERAKSEVSFNSKSLISNCLYIITNIMFVYFAYIFFDGTVLEIIVALLIFSLVYFVPNVMKTLFKFFNVKGAISNTIMSFGVPTIFYCFFLLSFSSDNKELGLLNIPIFLQFVALLINEIKDLENAKRECQYIKAIEKYNSIKIENKECQNKKTTEKISKVKVDKNKKTKKTKKEYNKKKYTFCETISAPFCILGQFIIYITSNIGYFCKKTISKEYSFIEKIKSKNDDLKKLYKVEKE